MSTLQRTKTIDLQFCKVSMLKNGFILYELEPDFIIDVEHVKKMVQAQTELIEGKSRYVIVQTSPRITTTPEARAYDNLEMRRKITRAEAIIVNNIATRIGTNFYYKVIKPPYPVKVFKDISKGISWLESLSEQS